MHPAPECPHPARVIAAWWTVLAVAVYLTTVTLHLPVTDLVDALAKRYGFPALDRGIRTGFAGLGALALAALWLAPRHRRTVLVVTGAVLAVSVLAAQRLLVVTGAEAVHYLQYGLVSLFLVRGGCSLETAWLASLGLGVVDEAYQHVVLPRGTPGYLDWNDIVLNGIGAACGLALAAAWLDTSAVRSGSTTPRLQWLIAAVLLAGCALLAACGLLGTQCPRFDVTPGGREYLVLSAGAAAVLLGLAWFLVRYLSSWLASAPTRPRA
jgi:hypothetical protein